MPQVGLLLSTADHYRRTSTVSVREHRRVDGALQLLLESQYSVQVVAEHHLHGNLQDYPLIVVPECDYLTDRFRRDLAAYVHAGSRLLLLGTPAARLFAQELGIKVQESTSTATLRVRGHEHLVKDPWTVNVNLAEAEVFGALDNRGSRQPAAALFPYGRGHIGVIGFAAARSYLEHRADSVRSLVADVARKLLPAPLVEVHGSRDVELIVARRADRLLVHLINTSGPHQTAPLIPDIVPLPELELRVRLPSAPRAVTRHPDGRALTFRYENGMASILVPDLQIYDFVELTLDDDSAKPR